jgi:DNA-binding NarL/FixJ family response regulator
MARQQNNPARKTRLFVADDEPMIRKGLQILFSGEPSLTVCGEAANESDALEGILALKPDLAVVDLSLKQGDGLALITQLHERCPALKILVFSMHNQAHFVTAALAAGAHSYVVKEEGTERLLEAIQLTRAGESYLSKQATAKAPGHVPPAKPRPLTRSP